MKIGPLTLVNHDIVNFVHSIIHNKPGDFGPCRAVGYTDPLGALEAGVILHNWQPEFETIEVSAASIRRTWMTRSRLNDIADMAYNDLKCHAIIARHDPSNLTARKLWKALGAHEYILRGARRKGPDCMSVLERHDAEKSKYWNL